MTDDLRWNRVQELFHDLLDRSPDERREALDRVGAGDPALRREVESLLHSHESAEGHLESTIRKAAGELESEAHVGRRIGPWRILGEAGQGGMGTVFLAERADGQYEQKVALKVIRPGMDSGRILERFRRERQILAHLQHPHIARLLDGGLTESGHPYFAMEYVEGVPIDEYCDRHRLSVPERLRLVVDVCGAVSYAHTALVVHRDLKPDNILVTSDGQVRLLDFGIARMLQEDGLDEGVTATALAAMTPAYASPEQVMGGPIGTGTDIYSLGMILYELLTGERPYEVRSRSVVDIERLVCREDPERPSARIARTTSASVEAGSRIADDRRTEARRLRRSLAGDLDVICMKALRKEPERRYASVDALMQDIGRFLDGRPILARPDSVRYRLSKWAGRHRQGVAAGVVMLAGVSGLTVFYLTSLTSERDLARVEAAKATEVAGFLQGLFEVSDPSRSRGETVTARELLDAGAQQIASSFDAQPEVGAAMGSIIGSVYYSLGLHAEARPLLERALEQKIALHGEGHETVAETQIALAALLQDLGQLDEAETLFRASLDTRRRRFGNRHALVAESLSGLAFFEETRASDSTALVLYREALEVAQAVHPPGHHRIAYAEVKLAGMLRRTGDLEAAEPLLRAGLEAQKRHYGTPHPQVASTIRNLAALLRDREAFEEADALYGEAVAMRRALYGDVDQSVSIALNSHAILLDRMGETERAIRTMREAIAIEEAIHDGPHRSLAANYNNLALLVGGEEGLALYRRSLEISRAVLDPGHPLNAFPMVGIAAMLLEQGDPVAAEGYLREALAIRRAALPAGHRHIGDTLSALGNCLTVQGRFQEAEALLLEAQAILLEAEGAEAGRTRLADARLATLYERWHASEDPPGGR